jgi:uncharacterized protein (TIGR04255 family)
MTVKFKNPPINELVISAYFNPPLFQLRSEHIGLFWSKIKKDFPVADQQPPVGGVETFEFVGNDVFPMPRYWFVAADEVNLLQVQKNAFMLNWRRRDAEYPHFDEHLKPTFDRYFTAFEDFLRSEIRITDLKIDLCELTYINTIEACEYWSGPDDTPKVIPSFSIFSTGADTSGPTAFHCTYAYGLDESLQLKVTIRSAVSSQKPGVPVLVFEIRAAGRLGQVSKSSADAWFDRAHEAIINCFVGMTNKDIQHTYWQPVGEKG